MKKAEIKLLKEYAAKLPTELRLVRYSHVYNGKALEKAGIDVDPGFDYKDTVLVAEPVNHYEKMKAALQSGGLQAVGDYVKSVVARQKDIKGKNDQVIQEVAIHHEIRRLKRLEAEKKARWERSLLGRFVLFIKSIFKK